MFNAYQRCRYRFAGEVLFTFLQYTGKQYDFISCGETYGHFANMHIYVYIRPTLSNVSSSQYFFIDFMHSIYF